MTEAWGGSQAATLGGEPQARELHLEVSSGERMRRISEEPMKGPSLERSRSYTSALEKARMSGPSSTVKKALLGPHASLSILLPSPSAPPKRWTI